MSSNESYFAVGDRVMWSGVAPLLPDPLQSRSLKVTGFATAVLGRLPCRPLQPGIYLDTHGVWVATPEGMQGVHAYDQRNLSHVPDAQGNRNKFPRYTFVEDLPSTVFYEGDEVRYNGTRRVIGAIDYVALLGGETPESPGIYLLGGEPKLGWLPLSYRGEHLVRAEELELIRHGDVFQYYHEPDMRFNHPADEVLMLLQTGQFRPYGEPITSLPTAKQLINTGIIHGFYTTGSGTGVGLKFHGATLLKQRVVLREAFANACLAVADERALMPFRLA
jgi:hypothetical protein